jgi:hypothetical protein
VSLIIWLVCAEGERRERREGREEKRREEKRREEKRREEKRREEKRREEKQVRALSSVIVCISVAITF